MEIIISGDNKKLLQQVEALAESFQQKTRSFHFGFFSH